MTVTLTLHATPLEASTIRAAAAVGGFSAERLIEHAAVDMGGMMRLQDWQSATEALSDTLTVEMGDAEYSTAMAIARRLSVPEGRYLVLAALRYVCHQQRSYPPGSAWRAIQVPAC
ncbi:hypothetical protein [Corallococcus sicarius]|uniref:Uncharacterized protein n=1 Tax=Corallococcus sicarius TaxID=2316726 RepID=A0A3A8P1G8_9BACT|nr:hypothetical protein [Corallococcus sicarius]RKH48391.1 hypothetical protein D7X12_00180 [Corallococcus sicarius]